MKTFKYLLSKLSETDRMHDSDFKKIDAQLCSKLGKKIREKYEEHRRKT